MKWLVAENWVGWELGQCGTQPIWASWHREIWSEKLPDSGTL